MQTVFKIQLAKSAKAGEAKPFIPRKAHHKSRGGCAGCKRRRVKCDEIKPSCGKCVRTNSKCIYPASSSAGSSPTSSCDVVSLNSDMYSMSVDLLEHDLADLLHLNGSGGDVQEVRMLQHFQGFTSVSIGSDLCKSVMNGFVVKEAWLHPHLMHMALAVSAAHLKRLHLQSDQVELYQQYSFVEAKHWERGLQNHRQALTIPKPDFDATLASTLLSIVFSFSLDDEVPVDAYTSNDDEKLSAALDPLSASLGFRALQQFFGRDRPFLSSCKPRSAAVKAWYSNAISHTGDFINDSVWKPVLLSADNEQGNFSDGTRPGIDGMPAAFVELCELDEHSTNENNQYHFILRTLTPLLQLEPGPDNFTALMAFCGRTWFHLRPLALNKDPRALLILSYWFALARQISQWWMTQRAKSECMAIVHYLSQVNDPKINALLPFPASFCLADLDYIWDPIPSTT